MKEEVELAQRALELAMLISFETTTVAWFGYSGHVNIVEASYSPNGWKSWMDENDKLQTNSVCIASIDYASVENLQHIIDCFEFILAVAEKKSKEDLN